MAEDRDIKADAENTKIGVVLAGVFQVAKVAELGIIAPIVILADWFGLTDLLEKAVTKRKDKRSATMKKILGE